MYETNIEEIIQFDYPFLLNMQQFKLTMNKSRKGKKGTYQIIWEENEYKYPFMYLRN